MRQARGLHQFGHNRVKVEQTESERRMGGRLVLAIRILVALIVGVNQVDVIDASGEFADKLNLIRKDVFAAFLTGSNDAYHLAMASVIKDPKVGPVHGIVDADDIAGFVESEARLEFPGDGLTVARGDVATLLPRLHDPIECGRVIDFAVNSGWLDGVDADASDANVFGELRALLELRYVLRLVVRIDQFLAPKISGYSAKAEAAAGHLRLEFGTL